MSNAEEIRKLDTADGHETLIRAQWRDFASFAWQQYQLRGRGAIVVDLKRALADGNPSGSIPTYYVADESEQLKQRGGWPSDEIEAKPDLGARLPDGVPVHLFHGSEDDTAPPSHAELYARAIPQAEVHRLHGRDHQLNNDLREVAEAIQTIDANMERAGN